MKRQGNLAEVAAVFFKLGCIGFGGPAAHIAMMEEEVVRKRAWMDRQHFLDLMGATNLIPGPNSTEMTMHCGHERAGIPGLFVAGICFILPAVVLTGVLAWLYARYGQLPAVEPFIYGIKPAVLAIIAGAVWKLGQKAVKSRELAALGLLTLAAALWGVNEIAALLGAGFAGAFYFQWKRRYRGPEKNALPWLFIPAAATVAAAPALWPVFWTFLKVGAVLYGSGYVLFAYLDAEVVARGWITTQQLIDAVAVGQFTPGPVLSTATFVGYQLSGVPGALAATAGIFLPSFLFVLVLNPLVPRMRRSRWLAGFLDSVNVAAVAVIVAVLADMGRASLADWRGWIIAAAGMLAVFGPRRIGAMWIVLGGAVLGYLLG